MTAYPKADEQFIVGLRNWLQSSLAISDDPTSCAPGDKDLFKRPFIYVYAMSDDALNRVS